MKISNIDLSIKSPTKLYSVEYKQEFTIISNVTAVSREEALELVLNGMDDPCDQLQGDIVSDSSDIFIKEM